VEAKRSILLLCDAGNNPTEIADFLFCSRSSVYSSVKAYRSGEAEKGKASASTALRAFERDQSKFFRDVPHGDRHARLRAIGVTIRRKTRASAAETADAMRWHAARFSEPLDDEKWIERTAKSIERSF
jgi:Homeodomain-like domain-containing protein